MNKDIAMQWVEALESGKYVQGKGALDAGGMQCCLGVLCKLAPVEITRPSEESGRTYYCGKHHYTPAEVSEWAGAQSAECRFFKDESGYVNDLSGLNDQGNHDFNAVAALIRKYWEQL